MNQDRGSMQDALKQYKLGLGTFEQKMPLMGRKFNEFTEQCFAGNSLTEREKQLIALGIAINAQDEYCMIYHTKGCLDEERQKKTFSKPSVWQRHLEAARLLAKA